MTTDEHKALHAAELQSAEDFASSKLRQLVILCDGTSNSVDVGQGTNVFRMLSALQSGDPQQIIFYDPGVGSPSFAPGTTWWDQAKQFKERMMGLAFGNGVFENISQAYQFLMHEYREGDEIYIFGFSRGAFTARAVVGMVNAFGLLPMHSQNLLATLLNVYFTKDDPVQEIGQRAMRQTTGHSREALINKVRANSIPLARRDISVHFVGVWDTVATLGIPPLDRQISVAAKMKDRYGTPKKFRHVRQVLALDEQRVMFKPRQYQEADIALDRNDLSKQSLAQRWLPGAHCDVGGTYGDNFTLSETSMTWLVQEASQCGLRIDLQKLQALSAPANPNALPQPPIHSELYESPYWAAAGMCVREARYGVAMPMAEFAYPQDTVWKQRRSWRLWLAATFFVALFYWASGWAALGFGRTELMDLQALRSVLIEPLRMAFWQLLAAIGGSNPVSYPTSAHLKTAVFWDTLMILAYGYIAGRLMSRAFASLAGLNALQAKPKPVLNVLGFGLMALVLGDLLENIATLIWLAWPASTWPFVVGLTAVFVSLFSVVKLVGLMMSLMLLIWAAWHRLLATGR